MDAFVGEIRLFPYTYAPEGWFWCEGQILPLQQYAALFSLIGTVYGGNGTTNFALPNLPGRAVVAATQSNGNPPGLTPYDMGETFGTPQVAAPLAAHTHVSNSGFASGQLPTDTPTVNKVFENSLANFDWVPGPHIANLVNMAPQSVGNSVPKMGNAATGQADPHANIQPYLTLRFAINWNGYYPSYP